MSAIDDAKLLKMAETEILGEAKRATARQSVAGISGWQACPKLNKVFLTNTLLQVMTSNRLQSKKREGGNDSSSKIQNLERKLLKRNSRSERVNFIYKKPRRKGSQRNCDNVKNSKFIKKKFTGKADKYYRQKRGRNKKKANKAKKQS